MWCCCATDQRPTSSQTSNDEVHKRQLSVEDQTKTSGLQDIPFKTVFPVCFSLILNRFTLFPLFLLQRLFYPTPRGLTLLGMGQLRREAPP